MSEYQYYEFAAIDKPLTRTEMVELRAVSTRAVITPSGFTNHAHWVFSWTLEESEDYDRFVHAADGRIKRHQRTSLDPTSLPDAKPRKNLP